MQSCTLSLLIVSFYEATSWKKRYYETSTTLKIRSCRKINRWFSLDVIAAMLVYRTIEKKSFGNLTLLLCKIRAIICYCFVHQHGRLITWLQTIYMIVLYKYCSEHAHPSHWWLRVFLCPLPSPLLAGTKETGPLFAEGRVVQCKTVRWSRKCLNGFLSVWVQSIKWRVL